MDQLVVMQNNQAVTTSLLIAESFNKQHKHVLDAIDELKGVAENSADLFFETSYTHPQNKQQYRMYLMNRDGFTLLAMGFTGREAIQFKLKYIEAFNQMEQQINKPKTQLEILQGTINQLVEQDKRVAQLEGQVNNISNIVAMNNVEWREKVTVILRKIAKNWTGVEPYRSVINLSYEKLEKRAGCNLSIRLTNRKERAIAQGMTKSYVNKISKLDCIAEEKRLVEIYLQVIKEMAIQFRVNINDFQFDEVI